MPTKRLRSSSLPSRHDKRRRAEQNKVVNRLVEHKLIQRLSFDEYRRRVRSQYDGPKGAILATCSRLSLHLTLGERLLKRRKFDLGGARQILDVGCGAGQLLGHVGKYADPGAQITTFDLSVEMIRRARNRVKSGRPNYLAADLTRLPFADQTFDCVTCGYVLEHLPDPHSGLSELARVLCPGGRMLLLTTEDNFGGAWTSRLWYCRTYNRRELQATIDQVGFVTRQELWFTPMHRMLRAGGICLELEKRAG